MAINTSLLSNRYVKFVRTNAAMWVKLTSPDPDTLYFVIETGASEGSLYLGSTLIASSIDAGMNLKDLNDVVLGATSELKANHVLVYDGANWVNKPISGYMPVAMIGATEEADGQGGLVPVPVAGDNDMYLRGDGQWADPTVAVVADLAKLDTKVTGLETNLNTVIGGDGGKTMRAVAKEEATSAVSTILDGAPEAFDTLKEIADWILGTDGEGTDAADLIADVAQLKNSVYGNGTEANPGLETEVSNLKTTVANQKVSIENLANVVGGESFGLVKEVNTLKTTTATHTEQITELDQRLTWCELVEE